MTADACCSFGADAAAGALPRLDIKPRPVLQTCLLLQDPHTNSVVRRSEWRIGRPGFHTVLASEFYGTN